MTNFKKLCAFTLSELLLALTIVGVIAVLTVPVIVNNIQNRMFTTKLRNFVTEIEQLAQQELIKHRTRNLRNTDFSNPSKFLSDKHFAIVKSCSSTAKKDCWKITATGKDKVIYKTLNKNNFDNPIGTTFNTINTIMLKNGIMFKYTYVDNSPDLNGGTSALFYIDINGNEKPNILGRDFFVVYLDTKGKVIDRRDVTKSNYTLTQLINLCKKQDGYYCFDALYNNNWKMPY